MNNFQHTLALEIQRAKSVLSRSNSILINAPKGYLTIRSRKCGTTYYWTFHNGKSNVRVTKQINISHNPEMITALTDKRIATIEKTFNEKNLAALEQLADKYQETNYHISADACSAVYKKVVLFRLQQEIEERLIAPYSKYPYDPRFHKHVTDYGERVRSKSEQILANSFYAYGIPFHYEEKLLDRNGSSNCVYPDFIIFLPDGKIIIWEHLGMLSKENYCIKNAHKLNFYQQNGFVLGDNLILTMDDDKGNFSSAIINQIIQTQILPKLTGIEIDKSKIIKGTMASYL